MKRKGRKKEEKNTGFVPADRSREWFECKYDGNVSAY